MTGHNLTTDSIDPSGTLQLEATLLETTPLFKLQLQTLTNETTKPQSISCGSIAFFKEPQRHG